jgi:exoribonuclease-2
MQVLFEDDGDLKAGTVRSATEASFQVDSTTGKRLKVKSSAVLLRFEQPRAEDLLVRAHADAAAMDVDFLWQCAPQQEFGFEELAREYCGREPGPVEAAAILLRLQSAPIYFQRKGRGRFRPATPEVLQAALAAVERRRVQEQLRAQMVAELVGGTLPSAIAARGADLLIKPDRNGIEYKALEQAAHDLQMSPLRLLLARGAIASPYDWHLQSFQARAFPRGLAFAAGLPAPELPHAPLPRAAVPVFSIDDSSTTEIDDAFSVQAGDDSLTVGVHIAAPGLAITHGHPLDLAARARMSTVYAPGLKYTMLPEPWIAAFSLAEGSTVPALSLYLELDPQTYAVRAARSAVEAVTVAANLRYDRMEDDITEAGLDCGDLPMPFAAELSVLWRLANGLRAEREHVRGKPEPQGREEISIVLETPEASAGAGERTRVRLVARRRDAPLDRIVAELMIRANSHWGGWLDERGVVGIYRSQAQGRVRMSTTPAPHDGLGVAQYAWCTSPLRRYVDLVNQRQLIAAVRGGAAPYRRGDSELFAVVSGFDAAYTMYAEFQEQMERYWSLRWLHQESVRRIEARVIKGDLVRLQGLPMTARLAAASAYERGQRLELEIAGVDLVELSPQARISQALASDRDTGGESQDGDADMADADPLAAEERADEAAASAELDPAVTPPTEAVSSTQPPGGGDVVAPGSAALELGGPHG